MEYAERYDHRVVNDRLEDALTRIQRIMETRYPINASQSRPEG
jgi:guanylate kinase